MKPSSLLCLFVVILGCSSSPQFPALHEFTIQNSSFSGRVSFEELTTTTGFKVLLKSESGEVLDQTIFRYEPYRFDTLDVNRDGRTEIIVGVIKSTHFDPTDKKRLFILRIDDNHIRPLWMGSKVCQELIDFKALHNGMIQTLERTSAGGFSIGNYYWRSFGLTLDQYTHHEITLSHATQIFQP